MAKLLFVPGSPALVEELAPRDPAAARLRAAVNDQVKRWGRPRSMDVVCSLEPRWETAVAGSFGAWGAPRVKVAGGRYLPELLARYLLPGLQVTDVRASVSTPREEHITVVVLDGSAGLTERAPLALLPQAAEVHRWCQDLLAGHRPQLLSAQELEEDGIIEPRLWLEIAQLAPTRAQLLEVDDSLGVGRFVAAWEV